MSGDGKSMERTLAPAVVTGASGASEGGLKRSPSRLVAGAGAADEVEVMESSS